MSEEVAPHTHFQFADAPHQAETAVSGMWLFLASEVLFFGGLIVTWMFCRHWQPSGFDAGARETVLWIGTLNLFLLEHLQPDRNRSHAKIAVPNRPPSTIRRSPVSITGGTDALAARQILFAGSSGTCFRRSGRW
jgi:hypothetical protein